MIKNIKELILKYRELIIYGIFGVMTTGVDFGLYTLLTRALHIGEAFSQGISVAAAIVFAYIVNKIFVFRDTKNSPVIIIKQFLSFASMRTVSGLFQIFCVWLFVERLSFYDMAVKAIVAIIVILTNYIISKFLVFRR